MNPATPTPALTTDLAEMRLALETRALLHRRAEGILEFSTAAERMDESAFMQHGLELAQELTGSQIAFIHLVHDDQETIELVNWSRSTLENYCKAAFDSHYPVSQAGIWADALRQRVPVVINDYAGATGKHGLPEGHARLDRLISVPVIEGGLVRMMAGVGNKAAPYTDLDVETVRLVSETVWRIVGQRRAAAALRASEERHRLLADNASDVIWTMNLQGQFTYVSPSVEWLRGYTSAEVMQQTLDQALSPSSAAIARAGFALALEGIAKGLPFQAATYELEQTCKAGGTVWTEVSTSGLLNPQGQVIGIVGVTRDITQRRAHQELFKLATQVFAQGREGVTVTDAQGSILMANQAFTDITGYTQAEVLGRNTRILKSGRHNPEFYASMWLAISTQGHWAGEVWNRKKDGTTDRKFNRMRPSMARVLGLETRSAKEG